MRTVILLGPPGAGKGIQANLVGESFDLNHFETSKVLETKMKNASEGDFLEVEGEKYFFKEQRKLWENGKLCSPPFVTKLIEEKVKELHKEGKGIVFSGSPRTLYEGERIIPLLKDLYQEIIPIEIEISRECSIERNSHRRICNLMRHPILYNEETKELEHCPLDGSSLIKRGLDDPETIKVRFKEYKNRTYPLINYFKQEALEVKKIDGEQTPEQVFKEIESSLSDEFGDNQSS